MVLLGITPINFFILSSGATLANFIKKKKHNENIILSPIQTVLVYFCTVKNVKRLQLKNF